MDDWYERQYFGDLSQNGFTQSPAGDGYTLAQEYRQRRNPLVNTSPVLTIVSGDNQLGTSGQYLSSPLIVKASNSFGTALTNTLVTFTISAGGGILGTTTTGTPPPSYYLELLTDSTGQAKVYLQQPLMAGATNKVAAYAGNSQVVFTETTPVNNNVPAAPSDIVATPGAVAGETDLSWVNHADNATYILIHQSTDGTNWTVIAKVYDPTLTSYAVTNLMVSTNYYFGVAVGNIP